MFLLVPTRKKPTFIPTTIKGALWSVLAYPEGRQLANITMFSNPPEQRMEGTWWDNIMWGFFSGKEKYSVHGINHANKHKRKGQMDLLLLPIKRTLDDRWDMWVPEFSFRKIRCLHGMLMLMEWGAGEGVRSWSSLAGKENKGAAGCT